MPSPGVPPAPPHLRHAGVRTALTPVTALEGDLVPQPQDDEHWLAVASCAGDDRFTCDAPTPDLLAELQAVCACCPVTAQCDALALDVEAVWGMWAGQWRTWQSPALGRPAAAGPRATFPRRAVHSGGPAGFVDASQVATGT